MNQKLESLSLSCSEQLDQMNKLNDKIIAKKKENNFKEEVIQGEISSLKFREIERSNNSQKVNIKINEAMNNLKILDEKKNNLEKQLTNVQKDREDISFDFDNRQNFFNDLNRKINELSIKIRNFEHEKLKKARKTGNSKLDFLLREKINMQVKIII
jgi:chromosome segregation ATPase